MPKTKKDTSKAGRMSRPTFEERANQAAKTLENEAWHICPQGQNGTAYCAEPARSKPRRTCRNGLRRRGSQPPKQGTGPFCHATTQKGASGMAKGATHRLTDSPWECGVASYATRDIAPKQIAEFRSLCLGLLS
jgi:hypothetical protein